MKLIKKLHLTCHDKHNIGNTVWEDCLQRYREIYSDFDIILYDDKDIYTLIGRYFPQYLKEIKQIKIGAVLADIFRYLILFLEEKTPQYSSWDVPQRLL